MEPVTFADVGHYTDAPEDNLLGLTDKTALNEQEALGVARVERYLLEQDLRILNVNTLIFNK